MLAAIVAVVLAIVPGAILGFAVAPGAMRWVAWSVAPVLSLGLTAVGMAWLPAIGAPHTVDAVLVAEFLLGAAAVIARQTFERRRGNGGARHWWSVAAGRPRLVDAIAVGIPAAICAVFGLTFFGSFSQPPGWDAMYHGMLTRAMLDKGTTVASAVCTTGSTQPTEACHFYPLAADVQWGQAASLSGGRIGPAMLVWEAVIGPVALVVALFVLLRLLGARALVAGSAAASVIVIGPLWMSTLTGRITQELAPGLALSVVVLVVAAIRRQQGGSREFTLGILAGVAAAGVLLTHSYEILFAAVFILAAIVTTRALRKRSVVLTLATVSASALLAVAPMLGTVLGAGSERAQIKASMPGDVWGAFRFWVTNFQRYVLYGYPSPSGGEFPIKHTAIQIGVWLTLVCMIAAPLCLAFRELRWARPWLLSWAVWTAIGIWTASSNSRAALAVSGLWYGVQERLRSIILPVYGVLTVAGACAIGLCVQWLIGYASRRRGSASRRPALLAAAVPVAVVAVLLLLATTPSVRRPVARDMAARTPHGGSYPAAFRWLAQHTDRGRVVAYSQNKEMITWSYVDDHVPYLFGLPPVSDAAARGYADRWVAWDWLVDNSGARPADCLVSRFGIEYVVVGGARIPNFPVGYRPSRLAHSPRLALVHQEGTIKIYKVKTPETPCPTPGQG